MIWGYNRINREHELSTKNTENAMRGDVTVEIIVDKICDSLGLKKIQLARMIGINESTLSGNLKKSIQEIASKKTGKRLLALSYIILKTEGAYSPTAILEALNEPTISNILGYKESVLSAIKSGRQIDGQIYFEKTLEGIRSYEQKKLRANQDLCNVVKFALQA